MMLTVALVFIACLGDRRESVRLPFEGSVLQCALAGQQAMAAWQREHQGWRTVGRYQCTTERDA